MINNSIRQFKMKLRQLTSIIGELNPDNTKVKELKKSLYVLNLLLKDETKIPSPYGPETPIVRQSLN